MSTIKITAREPDTLEIFRSGVMFYHARSSDRMVTSAHIEDGKGVGRVSTLTIEIEKRIKDAFYEDKDYAYFLNSRGEMIQE